MSRPFEPVEYDEPEVVLSRASRLRRRFLFFSGIILVTVGLILAAVFFFYPSFILGTWFGILALCFFATGGALCFGSFLVSPVGRGLGFFVFRFRPLAAGFLGCAIVACLSWGLFFLFLDNLGRIVAGIAAALTIMLAFRIYKRSTRESSDSLHKDQSETPETSLPS